MVLGVLALVLSFGTPRALSADSMEGFIDEEMAASSIPGLAYGVVTGGEITSVGAHGVVEIGSDREVTPDTPFLTGSISKSFTALAVMQLVEAGVVDLDDELSRYLDGFAGHPAGAITIRQLLSHTSGFSTLQGNASNTDAADGRDGLARRVDALAGSPPAYEPGERWEYSNTNYQILGRVIEVVAGQEYQAYVATHIFAPIGMERSFVADGEIHDAMATGHRPWFFTKRPVPDESTDRGTAPQGGVVSSAGDLALYLQTMINGADDVLSSEGKAQMMRPAGIASPFYGFGWYVDTDTGTVWHSGLSPGFETLATMVPSEQRGVVVLVNANGGIGFGETTRLRDGIAARALDSDYGGEDARWPRQGLFIGLGLLPFFYLFSMIWAWFRRDEIRAKSGFSGLFSLWFPLFTTLVSAWVMMWLIPNLFGAPFGTLSLFQPDFGLVLIASAVTGVLWAVFRLGVAFTGEPDQA